MVVGTTFSINHTKKTGDGLYLKKTGLYYLPNSNNHAVALSAIAQW